MASNHFDTLPPELKSIIFRKKHQVELEDCMYEIKNCILRMTPGIQTIEFAPEHANRKSDFSFPRHCTYYTHSRYGTDFVPISHMYFNSQLKKKYVFKRVLKAKVARNQPFYEKPQDMEHIEFLSTVPHMTVPMLKNALLLNGVPKSKVNKKHKSQLIDMIYKIE